ncbi:MAG: polyprenol monophosphomannose synthase [Planctomycetota bacterium]
MGGDGRAPDPASDGGRDPAASRLRTAGRLLSGRGGGEAPARVEDPARAPVAAGGAWLVATLADGEALIRRGADSARVASLELGDEAAWARAAADSAPGEPLLPPRPYEPRQRTVVVLPTYNEAKNLEPMVDAIRTWLAADVLVVDDGSPDGTGALADSLSAIDPRVHVLHRQAKEGLGRAYVAGFRRCLDHGYEAVVQMDCDFSHAPWDLCRLVAGLEGHDLVIGSRYVPGGRTDGWGFRRRLLSRGANVYAGAFLGFGVHDWTGGFRCWRASLLEALRLGEVASNGYSFQVEMAWRSRRRKARIVELPIRFVDREAGVSKMSTGIALEAVRVVPALRFRGVGRS